MILVTGGTGFLGSYLLRYLVQQNVPVRSIKREKSDLSMVADIAHKIDWVEADILEVDTLADAMKGITKIYHSAAIVSYQKKERDKMMQVNIQGTANVVNIALDHNVEKLIHVSSIAALGRKKNKQEIDEKAVWEHSKYNNAYGISKYRSEQEVWRGVAEGLPSAIVNPSIILGAGRKGDPSYKIFEQVRKGIKIYTEGTSGYVDVRDVVKIMHTLMESDISGERFVVNGENLRLKDILDNIANAMGKKGPSIKIPPAIVKRLAPLEALRANIFGTEPLFTPDLVKSIGNEYFYKNDKVRQLLDYSFIPIDDTIRETVSIIKEGNFSGTPSVLSFH